MSLSIANKIQRPSGSILIANVKLKLALVIYTVSKKTWHELVANLPVSLPVKEFWKSVNIWGSYGQEFDVLFFETQCTYCRYFWYHWPRGPPLLCWFQLPQAGLHQKPVVVSVGGGQTYVLHGLYLPCRFWRSKNPVFAAVMEIFIDFHQRPPKTIWQGPRRPLHKWPLLKCARVTGPGFSTPCLNISHSRQTRAGKISIHLFY